MREEKDNHQSRERVVSEKVPGPFSVSWHALLTSHSDPLPFQCLARYPTLCKDVTFVDVDYAQLMVKKSEVVDQTVPFRKLLTNFHISPPDSVINLRSNEYLAVGCDLRDVEKLKETLAEEFDMDNCLILCIAEVSISYMDVDAADALIRWAAALRDGKSSSRLPLGDMLIYHFPCSALLSSRTIRPWWTPASVCEDHDSAFQQASDSIKMYSKVSSSGRPAKAICRRRVARRRCQKFVGSLGRLSIPSYGRAGRPE